MRDSYPNQVFLTGITPIKKPDGKMIEVTTPGTAATNTTMMSSNVKTSEKKSSNWKDNLLYGDLKK